MSDLPGKVLRLAADGKASNRFALALTRSTHKTIRLSQSLAAALLKDLSAWPRWSGDLTLVAYDEVRVRLVVC